MNRLYLALSFSLLFVWGAMAQTAISGVINQYTPVNDIVVDCLSRIEVEDTTGFRRGEPALLIQMQGAEISPNNDDGFGRILSLRNTGKYERILIDSVGPQHIFFEKTLLNDYAPQIGSVQLITIPTYTDATVTDTLRPKPWDGSTGGVLILEVQNTLSLQAPIIASTLGFRGGIARSNLPNDCSWLNGQSRQYYSFDSWRGALKGEGLALYIQGREAGRGPQANGGGGGNDHNSGGGGGGNAHAGGQGGENNEPSTFGCKGRFPGKGGYDLLQNADFLFMGGGGGAGHGNNNSSTDGGNGGGIIILVAGTIQANNQTIASNGASVPETTGDGAGGGGAAGTIALLSNNLLGFPRIELNGGDGGDVNNNNNERCFGPGGGGSPGFLMTHSTIVITDYDLRSRAGQAGRSYNSSSCNAGNNNAESSTDIARLLRRDELPISTTRAMPTVMAAPDTIRICENEMGNWQLSVTGFGLNFQWQWNQGNGWENIPSDAIHLSNGPEVSLQQVPLSFDGTQYRLQVTDLCGQRATSTATILRVSPRPSAGFSSIINGTTVVFTDTSSNANNFTWDFGDGTFSNTQNPTHDYGGNGQYIVQLIAMNSCGADTISSVITIDVLPAPTAAFSASPLSGCTPLQVQFNDLSGPSIQTRNWQFPGGTPNTSTDPNPLITYSAAGAYDVFLQVENTSGTDEIQQLTYITVQDKPSADFSFSENFLTLDFSNSSTGATSYQWDFGDGQSSNEIAPTHTYANGGQFTIQLIASNPCGNDTSVQIINLPTVSAPTASFSSDVTQGCVPLQVQFTDLSGPGVQTRNWQFPGGTPGTSTERNPLVTYATAGTYDVILEVSNTAGSDAIQLLGYISVQDKPNADFSYNLNFRTLDFNNNTTNATSYRWNFGDGQTSIEAAPTHTYASGGLYTVQLIATNNCGNDTSIQIIDLPSVAAPTASFSSTGTQGCSPLTVTFTDNSSPDILQRVWYFDGGTPATSTEASPTVIFSDPGTYGVELEVTNSAGTNVLQRLDYVAVEPSPMAAFDYSLQGDTLILTNLSSDAQDFRWSFGDGNSSTEIDPVHIYNSGGLFRVTLVAKNQWCSSVISVEIPVLVTATLEAPEKEKAPFVFPNPTNGELWIQWPGLDREEKLYRLYSTSGQLIREAPGTAPLDQMDLNNLGKGVYLLEMQSGKQVWWEKVILQ